MTTTPNYRIARLLVAFAVIAAIFGGGGVASGQSSQVANIAPVGGSNPTDFVEFMGEVYFAANDGTTGSELWKTDGVTTTQVADIDVGPGSSAPADLIVCGGCLFFTATTPAAGRELWKFDGVTTTQIADLNSDPTGSNPTELVCMNVLGTDYVFFAADAGGSTGRELHRSDGNTIELVVDLLPGQVLFFPPNSSNPTKPHGGRQRARVRGRRDERGTRAHPLERPAVGPAADAAHEHPHHRCLPRPVVRTQRVHSGVPDGAGR